MEREREDGSEMEEVETIVVALDAAAVKTLLPMFEAYWYHVPTWL